MDHNLREIYGLNQRGGRPLSLLDLVQANTVDLPVAAYLAGAVSAGASLLTAARPGNAGKTTVLAALLAFLPPGRRIITVDDERALRGVPAGSCLLAHEIGSGPYYGYLWGTGARRFFERIGPGVSAASCIHADTPDELRGILCGPAVGISGEGFAAIDLLVFLRLEYTRSGARRRVASVYEADGSAGHRQIVGWDERTDAFAWQGAPGRWAERAGETRRLLEGLGACTETAFEAVYAAAQTAPGA